MPQAPLSRCSKLLLTGLLALPLTGCFNSRVGRVETTPEPAGGLVMGAIASPKSTHARGLGSEAAMTRPKAKGGVALMMEAARQGNETLVRNQLAAGIRVNAIDRRGETALNHAIRHERHGVALLLIAEGANVDVRDADGNTPLNNLCLGPTHYPMVRDMDGVGGYKLEDSFYVERYKVFDALLKAHADVNLRDSEGVTPLMRALWCGWRPTVDVLVVDAGDNMRLIEAHKFSGPDSDRWPGLAAQSLNAPPRFRSGVVETTDSLGALSGGGEPLSFTAVYRTDEDVVRRLLNAGADPDARNATDCKLEMGPSGGTPLIVAVAMGDGKVVDLLIKAGADVNARDAQGRTALMYAAMRGDGPVVRRLLSAGADRSSKDNGGYTAFQHASSNGHRRLAELLENPSAYRRFIDAMSNLF